MKYAVDSNFFDVDLEEKKILLDVKDGRYFELNRTAKKIFNLIKDNPKTLEEIHIALLEDYEDHDLSLKQELEEFLNNTNFIKSVF